MWASIRILHPGLAGMKHRNRRSNGLMPQVVPIRYRGVPIRYRVYRNSAQVVPIRYRSMVPIRYTQKTTFQKTTYNRQKRYALRKRIALPNRHEQANQAGP